MYEMRDMFDLQTPKEIVETRFNMIPSRIKGDKPINEILSSFKISRPAYYKFYHRFVEYGRLGLHNLSRAPHNHGRKTPEDKENKKPVRKFTRKQPENLAKAKIGERIVRSGGVIFLSHKWVYTDKRLVGNNKNRTNPRAKAHGICRAVFGIESDGQKSPRFMDGDECPSDLLKSHFHIRLYGLPEMLRISEFLWKEMWKLRTKNPTTITLLITVDFFDIRPPSLYWIKVGFSSKIVGLKSKVLNR